VSPLTVRAACSFTGRVTILRREGKYAKSEKIASSDREQRRKTHYGR